MLHDNYLRLVESNKQRIEKVRSKTLAENSETTWATPKRVWTRPNIERFRRFLIRGR